MAHQMRLLFVVLLPLLLPAQPAPAPAHAEKLKSIFARFNHTDTPGCTVGVSRNDVIVLEDAFGMADLEHRIALSPDSILEAGSVSKQFTAAALLLLAQSGKIQLDDPVRKYIPEVPDYGAPLTIRHLIHHTSGLRDWGSVAGIAGWPRTTRAHTHADVLEIVSRQKALNYDPGDAYSYTNTGYNLAAILVSRVSATPFAEFTRAEIFEPLGMASTCWRDNFQRVVRKRATAYRPAGGSFETLMPFENVHGNGGLLTTVGDLLRWNRNFSDPKTGGPAFVQQQMIPGVLNGGTPISYAAGLMIGEYRGVREISHSGSTAGYRAWLARYPDRHLSVAVLCNTAGANAVQLGQEVAAVFLGPLPVQGPRSLTGRGDTLYRNRRTFATQKLASTEPTVQIATPNGPQFWDRVEPWTPQARDLAEFAGEYRSDEAGVTFFVSIAEGSLTVQRRPRGPSPLKPVYRDAFENSGLGIIRFLRGADGRVNALGVSEGRVWDLRFQRVR